MHDVVIVGGGISGIYSAICIKRKNPHLQVTILEGQKRLKKLLATGNGRCNLSNKNMTIDHYDGDVNNTIENIILAFDIQKELKKLGIYTQYLDHLLYPMSQQAKTIYEIFSYYLDYYHIDLIEDEKVTHIEKIKDYYHIQTINQQYKSKYVIVSIGSNASHLSLVYNRFSLLDTFKLKTRNFTPSIVSMNLKKPLPLKGVKVKAKVQLSVDNQLYEESGEILWTDYGISGICIMILSRYFKPGAKLIIDMLPEISEREYEKILNYSLLDNPIKGMLNYKLADYFMKYEKQSIKHLKHYQVEIDSLREEKYAQVCKGGYLVENFNEDLELKDYPNFYMTGEILNVTGDCGGYNIHFALASANHVAKAIINKERNNYVKNK